MLAISMRDSPQSWRPGGESRLPPPFERVHTRRHPRLCLRERDSAVWCAGVASRRCCSRRNRRCNFRSRCRNRSRNSPQHQRQRSRTSRRACGPRCCYSAGTRPNPPLHAAGRTVQISANNHYTRIRRQACGPPDTGRSRVALRTRLQSARPALTDHGGSMALKAFDDLIRIHRPLLAPSHCATPL